MAQVILTDRDTETPVTLGNAEAALVLAELRRTRPDWLSRLLDRFWNRNPHLQPTVGWDFQIVADSPAPGTSYDVILPDILRPRDGTSTREFSLGGQLGAWHAAAVAGGGTP